MRPSTSLGILLGAALGLAAGAVAAQSLSDYPPKVRTVCIDVSGRNLPARCQAQASRIDQREDICLCGAGAQMVTAPICPPGVRPPAESAAYEKARRTALNTHGTSLVGATYQGQPMCVAPRNPMNE
jgi:hypothetical protein